MTERFNQTLCRSLSKVCSSDQDDWDEKIDTVLMGYRASSQASTKHSPFFILYQEEMRLPIDVNIMPSGQTKSLEDEVYDDLDNTLHALLDRRNALFAKVEENIVNAQQKQKVIFTAVFIYTYRCIILYSIIIL